MALYNEKEEVFSIKDDVSDPTGMSDSRGKELAMDMTKNATAHPKFRYQNVIATCDLYAMNDRLLVNYFCPRCKNHNQIKSEKKEMRWEPGPEGGRLSVGKPDAGGILCTWPDCGLRIYIDDNVAKECHA